MARPPGWGIATGAVAFDTVFGNQPPLKLPEMTQLFADPQLKTLAGDMTAGPSQLL